MPKFGSQSLKNLATCRPDLQLLFNVVVRKFDCSILVGHRSQAEQDMAFEDGKSKLEYPKSKHNRTLSEAVDIAPCPINWDDRNRFYFFAGYVKRVAEELGIRVRWGGDWDSDTDLNDQNFNDLVHWELI